MSRVLETDIEKAVVNEAKAHGWKSRKQASPNSRAASDRLFIRRGRVVFIEFKKPGGKIGKAQLKEHHDIIAHGGESYILDSMTEALRVLKCF